MNDVELPALAYAIGVLPDFGKARGSTTVSAPVQPPLHEISRGDGVAVVPRRSITFVEKPHDFSGVSGSVWEWEGLVAMSIDERQTPAALRSEVVAGLGARIVDVVVLGQNEFGAKVRVLAITARDRDLVEAAKGRIPTR